MTYADVAKQINTMTERDDYLSPGYRARMLLGFAEDNANDTVYADKAAAQTDWDQVAKSSLELLVAEERDALVRGFFDRIGFTY